MEAKIFRLVAATLFVFVVVVPDLSSSIEITELSFHNRTTTTFTVTWGYRLNGYGLDQLQGFVLTVRNVFDINLGMFDVEPEVEFKIVDGLSGGSTYLVCVTANILSEIGGSASLGNATCDYVRTMYDPWDLRAKMAFYIGLLILLLFVGLMLYDFKYPRLVIKIDYAKPLDQELDDISKSTTHLTEKMH